MQWFSYIDKREVLQQEYSKPQYSPLLILLLVGSKTKECLTRQEVQVAVEDLLVDSLFGLEHVPVLGE